MAEDTLGILLAGLVKAIHVELTDEAIHFIVSEISRQDNLLELVDILNHELTPRRRPKTYFAKLIILTKSIHYIEDLKGFGDETCYLLRLLVRQ